MQSAARRRRVVHGEFYTTEIEATSTRARGVRLAESLGELVKVRLNALVLVTAAAGFVVAPDSEIDWANLLWMMLGTGLCAGSAAMLNQLIEARRDSLMTRTQGRPMAQRRFPAPAVFVGALAAAYAGGSVLVSFNGWLPALLAVGNIVIYAAIYTPLKRLTTLNTLVGAVCGAIPPMVGWSAATGSLAPGAWIVGGILFVWQLPHFMALAWMYRDDYRRGGFAMLSVNDPSGQITAQTMVLTSLTLIPLALSGVIYGIAGWWYAASALLLGGWLSVVSTRFLFARSDANARRVFFASISYLPLLLLSMVLDRGPVSAGAGVRGGAVIVSPDSPMETQ